MLPVSLKKDWGNGKGTGTGTILLQIKQRTFAVPAIRSSCETRPAAIDPQFGHRMAISSCFEPIYVIFHLSATGQQDH